MTFDKLNELNAIKDAIQKMTGRTENGSRALLFY